MSKKIKNKGANTIEFAVSAWLLYTQLGVAFLVPIGIVLACFLGAMSIGRATTRLLKAWMTATQQRISATANFIANIKSIKILGLTNQLENLIRSMREAELKAGASFRKWSVYIIICALAPMMLSPVLTFAATSQQIDSTRAFTSLALLMLLTVPLASLFQLLPNLVAATACFDRIALYLEADVRPDYRSFGFRESPTGLCETTPPSANGTHLEFSAFVINDGYFGWKTDDQPFAKGRVLYTSRMSGIGFCDQSTFIPDASVRNIIVGRSQYDEEWYNKIIEAVALSPDIATFSSGDLSMTGPNGSNLSGGQRHRLAIARALYARPAIFVFDDIFSGLDGPTENIVFEKVFSRKGLLRKLGATAILCSHAVKHLPHADHIIALGVDGRIVEQGTYEQLEANRSYVRSLNIQSKATLTVQSDFPTVSKVLEPSTDLITTEVDFGDRQRKLDDFTAYKRYLSTLGPISLLFFAILSLSAAFCNNFGTIWLKFWSDYSTQHPQDNSRQGFYLGVYAVIQGLGLICLTVAITITSITMVKRSGRIFHHQALSTLVAAPLSLFNKTPPGVLLNKFSQDLNIIDTELEEHFFEFIFLTEVSIGMAIVITTASPYLRILDLETKSPLFTHFLETLSGLPTVRAFGWTDWFITVNHTLVDTSQRPSYLLFIIQTWLMTALALMVAVLAIFVVVLATQLRADVGFTGASLVSLMSFGPILTNIIKEWTSLELGIGAVGRLESFHKAVKSEIGKGETEQLPEDWPRFGAIQLENVSASHRYDLNCNHLKDERLVLRQVSLTIKPREKIAIVGRTGSGKSSIILLLLRILNPLPLDNQVITVDGIPLQNIDHNVLRSRIIALPQDTFFLPNGNSYRANLDPHENASTAECEAALKEVRLLSLIKERGGLHESLKADSFSQGQKQLFGVARAVLRAWVRAKKLASRNLKNDKEVPKPGGVLLLDEITSNTDEETDALIQRVIRKEFEGYTIIAVTHRENTVQDFDRMVIMEGGAIKEIRNLRKRVVTSPH
ncbi:P-loop containing nucleoside triphosphate hydrolase protein [Clathrospora elynae]|uniref:P-loop containing nucleoside triphosphate hydrolase protein n=1 Tax=Clathrospora elynae TaxID=706981 RepID=A0A6A5T2V2_9PLEO|nr:P-loop containing nucleoside triphosphate hydrolase protein [Clathrospora elynae]